MYKYGYGVIKDKAEAVKWYRKLAEQGEVYAQEELNKLGVVWNQPTLAAKPESQPVQAAIPASQPPQSAPAAVEPESPLFEMPFELYD